MTRIVTTQPVTNGKLGKAWPCVIPNNLPDADASQATVAQWLIQMPGIHPAWDCWLLSIIHLRPIPNVKPANMQFPTATHEVCVMALDTREIIPQPHNLSAGYQWLRPLNVVQQVELITGEGLDEKGDELARELLRMTVAACLDGFLPIEPEGYRVNRGGGRVLSGLEFWEEVLKSTATHLTTGQCPNAGDGGHSHEHIHGHLLASPREQ